MKPWAGPAVHEKDQTNWTAAMEEWKIGMIFGPWRGVEIAL